eukprot:38048-Rhodomonas_salina.1
MAVMLPHMLAAPPFMDALLRYRPALSPFMEAVLGLMPAWQRLRDAAPRVSIIAAALLFVLEVAGNDAAICFGGCWE